MNIKISLNIKLNRVVKFLVFSDLLFIGSWSFIQPIFPIFLIDHVQGATLVAVGLIASLYWIVKSFLQIPIANYLDKTEGERDDFRALILGLFLAAISAYSFAFISNIWQAYLIQLLYAISMALYIPSWSGIFSRHLDPKRISFDWSLDSTVVGFASGVATFLSGILANWFGFSFVFFLVGTASLLSALIIFFAPNLVLPPQTRDESTPLRDHTPSDLNR